jgi:POT family proton-dependent oligopeptide transporter
MYTVGPIALLYLVWEMSKYTVIERQKLIVALFFIIFSIFFWAFFEQSGGSLSLFAAENLSNNLAGITIDPNVVNNSANSLFIILFSPLVGLLFLWMAKRNKEPNSINKFGLAFLFIGISFTIFYALRFYAVDGKSSLMVFTIAYLVITFAELFLSPIGLSLMTKLAPKPLHGAMMGMWFLASAYGQYVAGILGAGMATTNEEATLPEKLNTYTDGYLQLGMYGFVLGIVIILLAPFVKRWMHGVK